MTGSRQSTGFMGAGRTRSRQSPGCPQSPGYVVAKPTESRQSIGYLGAERTKSCQSTSYLGARGIESRQYTVLKVRGGQKDCILPIPAWVATRTESRPVHRIPWG